MTTVVDGIELQWLAKVRNSGIQVLDFSEKCPDFHSITKLSRNQTSGPLSGHGFSSAGSKHLSKGKVTLGKYLIKTFHITFKNLIETITKLPVT